MKYPVFVILYLVLWAYLIPYLILERGLKCISVIILIIWNLKYKEEWLERFDQICFVLPLPMICLVWQIDYNLKDYFLLNNWK